MRILNEMTHQIHMSLLKTSGFEGLTRKWMSCMDLLRGMVNIYKKGYTPSQDGVLVIIRTLDNDLRKQSSDFFEHMQLFQAEVQRFSGDSQDLVIPPADIPDGGVSHPLFQPDGVAPPPHPAFGGDAVGPSIFAIQPPIAAIAVPSTGQGGAGKRLRDSEVDDLWKGDTNGPLKKSRIPAAAAAMQPSARLTRQVGGEGVSAFSRPATGTASGRGEEVSQSVQTYLSTLLRDCLEHFVPSEIMHPMNGKVVIRNYKGHVITVKHDKQLVFVGYNPTTRKTFMAIPESPMVEKDSSDEDEDEVAPSRSALQRDLSWELTFGTQHFLHFRPVYCTAGACKLATQQTQRKTMAKMPECCVHFSSQVQDYCPVTWIIDVGNLKDYPEDASKIDPASFYKGMDFQMKIPKKSFVKRVKTPPPQGQP